MAESRPSRKAQPYRPLGQRIAELRRRARMSQREFADAVHISPGYPPSIESGRARPVAEILQRIAAVPDTHPHRFRHSFAIGMLRGGCDLYTLSRLLGHSTLLMTSKYLRAIDAEEAADRHRLLRPGSR